MKNTLKLLVVLSSMTAAFLCTSCGSSTSPDVILANPVGGSK